MIASFRRATTLLPTIMLMAVMASFAGPSAISTIRLLDGDEATPPATETHLPLGMAAAPDQTPESIESPAGVEGPVRVNTAANGSVAGRLAVSVNAVIGGSSDGRSVCDRTRLCVYRL